MFGKETVVIFVAFFLLSIVGAVLISDPVSLAMVSILLFISCILFAHDIWKNSDGRQKSFEHKNDERRWNSGDFASFALNLRGALHRSSYSRREIAIILREAFLNRYVETANFPAHWIYTDRGKEVIVSLLGSDSDLIDVLEPSDEPTRAPIAGFFIRGQDLEYESKLERVLCLVETEIVMKDKDDKEGTL